MTTKQQKRESLELALILIQEEIQRIGTDEVEVSTLEEGDPLPPDPTHPKPPKHS